MDSQDHDDSLSNLMDRLRIATHIARKGDEPEATGARRRAHGYIAEIRRLMHG